MDYPNDPLPRTRWPRGRLLPRDGKDRLIVGSLIVLIFIAVPLFKPTRWFWEDWALDDAHETTKAMILRADPLSGKRGARAGWRLHYTFVDGQGTTHHGAGDVDLDDKRAQRNDATIEYDRENPARNRLRGERMARHGVWSFLFGVGLFAGGIAAIGVEIKKVRQRRRLLQQGLAARATVELVESWRGLDRNAKAKRLRYAFVVNGTSYYGTLVTTKAPAPGSPIYVLYDEAHPEQNMAA